MLSYRVEFVVFCHRWENHKSYVQAIRDLRLKELRCESRMAAVRCGLSSVVPLHVLTVMTPLDMEIRTCGQPSLDLGFLKVCYAFFLVVQLPLYHLYYISLFVELTNPAYNLIVARFLLSVFQAHTAYVAGVKDTDVHIEYFWNSMESFSQVSTS